MRHRHLCCRRRRSLIDIRLEQSTLYLFLCTSIPMETALVLRIVGNYF